MSETSLNISQDKKFDEIETTKQFFRKKVWDHLTKNKIARFPNPYGRIPNFKGAEQAAEKLIELEAFKSAKSVEVNPDKPLEPSRFLVLKNGKELYVPVPRLHESLLKKLSLENGTDIRKIVSRWGIENTGKKIGLSDKIHIDLLVLGSVAVSKEGYRIGKGKGYADLEFALLKEMGAVDDNTVIATTVHDSQVFDELPKELFKKYDVPVEYILTPTQIIKTETSLSKPQGIYWNLISQTRVDKIEILQRLKKKHESEGRTVILAEENHSNSNKVSRKRFSGHKRYPIQRSKSENEIATSRLNEKFSNDTEVDKALINEHGYLRRLRSLNFQELNYSPEAVPFEESDGLLVKAKKKNRKQNVDFSLYVSNIERCVRVRDLKNVLIEKGIKPDSITWKGYRGYCYLHYTSKNSKIKKEDTEQPLLVDNVLEILQDLKITPNCKKNLNVKVMEPITRIETTDVTAV